MNANSPDFFTLRMSRCGATVDEMTMGVAGHVKRGLYKIIGITATEKAFIVVCATALSMDELDRGTEGGWFPGVC